MNVVRQTARIVVNQIMNDNFDFLCDSMTMSRASNSMMVLS